MSACAIPPYLILPSCIPSPLFYPNLVHTLPPILSHPMHTLPLFYPTPMHTLPPILSHSHAYPPPYSIPPPCIPSPLFYPSPCMPSPLFYPPMHALPLSSIPPHACALFILFHPCMSSPYSISPYTCPHLFSTSPHLPFHYSILFYSSPCMPS